MAKAGATVASNPAEVASQSGTIVTMLPNNDIVTAVYSGKDGIFQYEKIILIYVNNLQKNISEVSKLDLLCWTLPLLIPLFLLLWLNRPMRRVALSWTLRSLEV